MRVITALGAAAMLAMTACAGAPPPEPAPPPPPPVAAKLEAGSWSLAALENAPPPAPLSISFADGSMQGKAFCNRFFGDYLKDGQILRIVAVGSTRMACPHLDAEQQFFGLFTDTDHYEIDADGRLTLIDLNGGRGLVFARP